MGVWVVVHLMRVDRGVCNCLCIGFCCIVDIGLVICMAGMFALDGGCSNKILMFWDYIDGIFRTLTDVYDYFLLIQSFTYRTLLPSTIRDFDCRLSRG